MPKTFDIGSQHVIVRAEASNTGGVCALLEMHHPANSGPPLHSHMYEDEGFFILDGVYEFQIGEGKKTIRTGDFILAARTVAHSFRSIGPQLGKMLVYLTPAGGEKYFEEMSRVAMDDPQRNEKCAVLDAKFGIKILGRGV